MKASVLAILTNKEVLALNQDTFGLQANRIAYDGSDGEVFAKRLGGWAGTERGVVLFNRSGAAKTMSINFKDIDMEGSVTVRDLWAAKDLGPFQGSYSVSVPSHGVAALKIGGGTSKLQETFEAEYALDEQLPVDQEPAGPGRPGQADGGCGLFARCEGRQSRQARLQLHRLQQGLGSGPTATTS